jgi:hypothetical protein
MCVARIEFLVGTALAFFISEQDTNTNANAEQRDVADIHTIFK